MKFGMPTLVECNDIFECHKVAKSCCLDFIEINMSFPQYQPSNLDTAALKKLCRADEIFYTIHADEMLNPFDFDNRVSNCYFDVMRDTIRFAKELSVPVINMHLLKGVYVTLPNKVVLLNDIYFDKYREKVRQFVDMCESVIGDSNVKICLENVDSNPFTESQIRVMDIFMNSEVFGLTLDTGHEFCLNYADSPVFKQYADKLYHMHLHDAVDKKTHLPLGEGILNVKEKLSSLTNEATCLIEVKTVDGLEKSIEYIKELNGRDYYDK